VFVRPNVVLRNVVHRSSGFKGPSKQNLWLESTYLKHNLAMSLSKEMWYWRLTIIMTTYLKSWKKMHENWGKSLFCHMDKNMISPNIEWCIGKCPGLWTISFKTSTWCKYLQFMLITLLFRLFGLFKMFFPFNAQTLLFGL